MTSRTLPIVACVVILTLAVGCGTPEPTPTAELQPSPTSAPPTDLAPTAAPRPTDTSPPPTEPSPLPPTTEAPTDTPTLPSTTQAPTDTPQPPAATATAVPTPGSALGSATITFVNNAGFLIAAGDRKILIDALSAGEPVGVLRSVAAGRPPFDAIDLILVTHEHRDHFSPDLVASAMSHSPGAVFVSTQRVVEQLLAVDDSLQDRAIPIQLQAGEREQLDVNGIGLEALYISHGMPGLLNLGFVITVGDVQFFHTGDSTAGDITVSYLQSYGLPEMQLDVAFVPSFYLTQRKYQAYALEGIQARYIIPMHYEYQNPPLGVEDDFPNAIVFQDTLERWDLPLPAEASDIEITYICNAGFLISCHGKKILVDALFRGATAGCRTVPYMTAMKDAQPPFDGVDLIVATHAHADHFDAQIVGTHLTNNPQAVFVSTRQSVDSLLGDFPGFDEIQDRVVGADLQKGQSTQLTLKGIHLEFINIPHVNVRAGGIPNLGAFLQVGGLHLFHPGDAEPTIWQESYFQAYDIANRQIDIAFIPQRFFTEDEYHSIIVEGIGADEVIPMHFFGIGAQEAMDEIAAEFPEAILFREEMQSWVKVYPSDTPGAAPSPSPTPTAVPFQAIRDEPYVTAGHPKQQLDIYVGFRASTHSCPREDRFVVVLENVRSGSRLPGVFDVGRNIAAILYGCSYDNPGSGD